MVCSKYSIDATARELSTGSANVVKVERKNANRNQRSRARDTRRKGNKTGRRKTYGRKNDRQGITERITRKKRIKRGEKELKESERGGEHAL